MRCIDKWVCICLSFDSPNASYRYSEGWINQHKASKHSLQICVSVSHWKAIKTAELTAGFGQAIWNIRTKKITYAGLPQTTGAHQAASMAFNELLDLPLDISHVCHVSLCVNPDHLSHKYRIEIYKEISAWQEDFVRATDTEGRISSLVFLLRSKYSSIALFYLFNARQTEQGNEFDHYFICTG